MDPRIEVALKLGLCVAAIVILGFRHLRSGKTGPDKAGIVLVVTAVVAALAYTNFGFFTGWPPTHPREQFHYFLGSKYFPELSHDGLYLASLQAEKESHPSPLTQSFIRDLRTNEIVSQKTLLEHRREVRERFGRARWQQFVNDHAFFVTDQLPWYRVDHGFNPSPTWTFVGRLFSASLRSGTGTSLFLASLDFLMLAVVFFGIFRTYGSRVGCMALIVFGLGAPWRYDWMGGAFLRYDWLAALALGICCLKRERFVLAGGLIGYATMIRVFPGAFLVGAAVLAVRHLVEGRRPRWFVRLATGVAVAVLICLLLGTMAGRGTDAWPEFLRNAELHRNTLTANDVGVRAAFVADRAVAIHRSMAGDQQAILTQWDPRVRSVAEQRGALILAVSIGLALLALAAMWDRSVDEAAVLGMVVIFALLSPSSYYWVILLLLPIVGTGWLPAAAVLAISAMVFGLSLDSGPVMYERIYGPVSWALLLLWIVWLGPGAVRSVRKIGTLVMERVRG